MKNIGLLLITHYGIGDALLHVARSTFGNNLPLKTAILSVSQTPDSEQLVCQAKGLIEDIDEGGGTLVITDMFGSTPSNVSKGLINAGYNVAVVAGLNLPMLIRILNYPNLPLNQMAEKALSGGKEGVFYPYTAPATISATKKREAIIH